MLMNSQNQAYDHFRLKPYFPSRVETMAFGWHTYVVPHVVHNTAIPETGPKTQNEHLRLPQGGCVPE